MKDNDTNDSHTNSVETTDSWEWKEIIKYAFLPKPEGSPKTGKKELGVRIGAGVLLGVILLSTFSSSAMPTCTDAATKDYVLKSITKKMKEQFGSKSNELSYNLSNLTTLSSDEITGFQECIAKLEITEDKSEKNKTTTTRITYNIGKSSEDNEFHITLTRR